ncbi:MAG: hypothetical protein M1818_004884 [Claussenomyces sp. TS43310]|nr:MAG: hypothetical protein M1818_004884 [Claussenomyces sp. TS43310]
MFDGFILSLFLLFVCVLSLELNPVLISVIANFSCISCQQLTGAWINPPRFSSDPQVLRSLSSILIQFGTINTIHMDGVLETSQSAAFTKVERRFWSFLVVLISLAVLPQLGPSESLDEHTIDILMKDAISSHDHYMKQASSSATLQAAVLEYRARYHCHPPPNFDKWFEFATSRNAVVIDDYDQIWNDLRPFMTIAPSVLRNATNDVLLNPWNDIAGLSIRNGSTYVGPHIVGTHRWMLDGISAMIDKFSNWLPDMDLGFNIDDECRVVAPWRDIDAARRQVIAVGMNPQSTQDHDFSDMLSFLGQPLWMNESAVLEYGPTKLFPDESFQQSLYDYGATNCAPGSPARSTYKWNRLNLYPEYATPYSDGHFVRNWSLSGNMCFQPDMAHLHGFHMSPATFKTSRKLQPVFSQSKVPGYNDILYPSPWNYVDKVSYNAEQDIPFADKKNTLFWRGSTSEGMSLDGTWQGMQRQRFVYLANNNSAGTRIPMLLPHGNKFRYKSVRYDKLKEQLRIDASLVDRIQRCSFEDCRAQEVELGLSPPVDFQTHWKYRYLADFDGAGFSGRFLPFLYSKSVPFKVALFREWYDDRLMPWMHFVPLDSRLHGVYSTLAYFAGYRDGSEKEVVGTKSAARLKQGEWIAEQGSAWAKKVLRKEDMEIYFFRLLLEWGRVIDDRRDDIGFLVV